MEKLLGTPGWIGSRGGEWGTKRGGFTSVGLDIAESSRAPAGMDDAGYAFTAGVEETERETLERIYRESVTIAVVGASADPSKPAHRIPAYLQEQGYRIHPVNPRGGELLGEPVATTLAEVDGPVDVVDVFRPAAEAGRHRAAGGHGRREGAVAAARHSQ